MRRSRTPEGDLPARPRKASPAAATPRRAQGVTPEGHCSHTTLSKRRPANGQVPLVPASGSLPRPPCGGRGWNRNRFASPGFPEKSQPAEGVSASARPSWSCPSFEAIAKLRSRYLVHGCPPRRFNGHAVLRRTPSDTAASEAPIDLGSPPGHTGKSPPESCAAPATLMRFAAPTATSARRSTSPGVPDPVRSVFRVSHPLDGFLPRMPSDLEDRCRSWGSPYRAFPPRRSVRLSAPVPSCRS